ncbi:MAG TPA: Gfo/Idh/MocA family oxidoreductase, partial [bacterium]|nr:Gfo/Idh/MocA family oxidoreductase [bacterium]
MKKKENITRRDFISKGAMAAAAPLILNYNYNSFAKFKNNSINVGIIGLGNRASHAHIPTILKFPDVKIAALCDISKERLEGAAGNRTHIYRDPSIGQKVKKYNPSLYQDYEALLKQKDLDCIFVATPPDRHKRMVCDALRVGFSVYVDKPMTLTVTDSQAIVKAAKKAKGVFIVGQQLRYNPLLRKKIELIHKGEIGKVVLVSYKVFRGSDRLPSDDQPGKKWILSIEQGGDIILEQGVHWIDVFNWIMGTHPIRAAGLGGQGILFNEEYDREIMDHYSLIYEYPGNRRVFFSHSWMSMPGV